MCVCVYIYIVENYSLVCIYVYVYVYQGEHNDRLWVAVWCGDEKVSRFEVRKIHERYVVYIEQRKCSDGLWEVSKIPYIHFIDRGTSIQGWTIRKSCAPRL